MEAATIIKAATPGSKEEAGRAETEREG